MTGKRAKDAKVEELRRRGCLSAHPERVSDPGFSDSEFLDSRDLVQVKYEMVRKVKLDGAPVSRSAAAFGFSRPTYYDAEAARYEADAKEHEDEASYYAGHQHPIATGHSPNNYDHYMVSHCPQIAAKLKEAAQESRALAAGHREMAKAAN